MTSKSTVSQYGRVSEVVEIFGLSADWWRSQADAGKVQVVRINNQRIFKLESCRALLEHGDRDDPGRPSLKTAMAAVNAEWRKMLR